MDLDIEMGDALEGDHDAHASPLPEPDDILQPDDTGEPGEIEEDEHKMDGDANIIISNKLNLHGVDSLHTEDIKAYVKTHFAPADKVEWVNDTSANLIFGTDGTAREALVALSSIEIADATALPPLETLPAKPLDGKPEVTLRVRFAVTSDKKQTGAALLSRYYLLHPEHDPEERRRRKQEAHSRLRDRDNSYRRGGGRHRRDSDEVEIFEASMYDEAPPQLARRRFGSGDRQYSHSQVNHGKELFEERASRRDRSASPMRDRDVDTTMDSIHGSSRNRDYARTVKHRIRTENSAKELFPSKSSYKSGELDRLEDAIGSAQLRDEDMPNIVTVPVSTKVKDYHIKGLAHQSTNGISGFNIKGAANARELFPDKLGHDNTGKELFDGRSRRRQKAQDLFS